MSYLTEHGTRRTPQSEAIPGSGQVQNSAGGFSYGVDNWTRLNRFLILGSEGGSYYAGERELTKENVKSVIDCVKEDGLRAVSVICAISKEGRAPKNDPAIFALAVAASQGDLETRRAALDALPEVCRIGTHLFQFATFAQQFRGWGRGMRRALSAWYTEKDIDDLAYQVVKYRQREGWTHRDVLRKAHANIETEDPDKNLVLRWVVEYHNLTPGDKENTVPAPSLPEAIHAFEAAQKSESVSETVELIERFGRRLPREALRTEHVNQPDVQRALIDAGIPMTALIRNLANYTRSGVLDATGEYTQKVVEQITNGEALRKARVHPIAILIAMRTYSAGYSLRGSNQWTAVPKIIDALDDAFYAAFGNLEATGKRRLLALDISGSMWGGFVAGVPGFTPAEASGAMAMVSMKTGDPYEVVAFAGGGYWGGGRNAPNQLIPGLSGMSLSPRQRLDDVERSMRDMSRYMGGTDCALPMLYASQKGKQFDVFEVYTDSETWAGTVHPSQALVDYRRQSGIDAKLVVVGMVSNGFSIADPNDPGMLDVVGFDTATPQLISAFADGGF